jgi:mono/diheme cytochrome c family protein
MRLAAVICAVAVLSGGLALAQTSAQAERGMKVYASSKPACSACHMIAGKGNKAGPLDGVGAKLSAEEIRQWLVDPAAMTAKVKATRKPPMPTYAKMAKEDLDALVAYMQTLKKK